MGGRKKEREDIAQLAANDRNQSNIAVLDAKNQYNEDLANVRDQEVGDFYSDLSFTQVKTEFEYKIIGFIAGKEGSSVVVKKGNKEHVVVVGSKLGLLHTTKNNRAITSPQQTTPIT